METQEVSIKYDGKIFDDHTFEIKELGRIFGSLGDIFEQTNKLINKDAKIEVKVNSNFAAGSFEFLITLQQILNDTIVPVLAGSGITSIINLYTMYTIIFGKEKSVLQLLRFLEGLLPAKIEKNGEYALVFKKDGTSLEVKSEALVLFEDKKVRKAIGMAIAESLMPEGADSIEVKSGEDYNKILKSERTSFSYEPENDEEQFDVEQIEAELEIVSMSFDPNSKWEFRNYRDTFSAEINCSEFQKKIENGEEFKKGDKLKTILQTEYYRTQQQIRKKRTIIQVIDHIKPARQSELL
jgi:hypothetical protein